MSDDFIYEPVAAFEELLYQARALSPGMVSHFKRAQRISELAEKGLIDSPIKDECDDVCIPYQIYIELLQEFPLFHSWQKRGIKLLICDLYKRRIDRQMPVSELLAVFLHDNHWCRGCYFALVWAEDFEPYEIQAISQIDASNGLNVNTIADAINGDPAAIFGDGDGLEVTEEFLSGFLSGVRSVLRQIEFNDESSDPDDLDDVGF